MKRGGRGRSIAVALSCTGKSRIVRLFWLNLNAPGGWLVLAFTGGIDFIPQKWYHWNLRIKSVRVLCDFQSAARSMMPFSCNTFFLPKGESCKSEKQAPVAANDDIRVDILPECVVGVRKCGCVAKMRTTTSPAPWRASLGRRRQTARERARVGFGRRKAGA